MNRRIVLAAAIILVAVIGVAVVDYQHAQSNASAAEAKAKKQRAAGFTHYATQSGEAIDKTCGKYPGLSDIAANQAWGACEKQVAKDYPGLPALDLAATRRGAESGWRRRRVWYGFAVVATLILGVGGAYALGTQRGS